MCTKTPDRAEYRSKMATSVCKLLTLFPDQLYSQLLEWLYRLSMNEKISWRVSSLEVISELLTHPLRQAEKGSLSGEEEYRLSCKYLVETALSHCLDKAPTVRVRALSCLAAAASSTRPEVISTVVKCLSSQMPADPLVAGKKNVRGLIIPMVRRRTRDLKVGVRKVALQALEALIRLDMTNINREDVLAIHERCMDPAVSVRKLAMVSLTSLITDLPQSAILIELWLDGVLPMVMDKETSAQEKCISILEAIILSNIAPLTDDQSVK
jgi:condensin-2 complex subunit D3